MKLRTFIAVSAVGAVAVAAPLASAQTPPVSGGTTIGATVPSMLELIITQPKATLAAFPKAKTYSTSFDVAVTTTDNAAQLSLTDGEVNRGSKMGRLASGKKLLPLPLEARVGKSAFAALNTPVESQLTKWNQAVARSKATVNLRQKVKAKASGNYRKVLLVTLSTDTP
ncbi:hypothetical protein DVA67_009340 [Solirubrobacter sp. CPCC 204708]|uniref:Uncharacterized protein n=1 Tax=Solirubrobacter deserti TaxID=2282478 RepID=A0ABT4RTB2_9ACTN|nr:hypothetical protein [Solirubrobacter deserti]MBE2316178.1 hypothetical protein [Solirubrobacter deserti]MDA0141804.1 hypothetical protein [Solirubrobacter deserti]